jgi:hypothetical protein
MTAGSKDKKKIMFLGGLGVVLLYFVYTNLLSGPSTPEGASDRPAAAEKNGADRPIAMVGAVPKNTARPKAAAHGRSDEFHPVYIAKRPEERPDPTSIDPTMRWDLLTKVQAVESAGGARNLFAFGAPPPPKPVEMPKGPETHVALGQKGKGPAGGPGGTGGRSGSPEELPLQINLKYYGVVAPTHGGKKTACFLDGDEILLATEGDTLKRRYRVVRIGNTSVLMEDTESKREQSLPLVDEAKV